jgi:hypothetical protein
MTDKWRCRSCLMDLPSKAFAVIHLKHWPEHDILHLRSEPDLVDPDEPVTLAEVLGDPSDGAEGSEDDPGGAKDFS